MTSQLTAFEISEAELLLNFIRELVNKNEIKALRKLLKNNPYYTQFKTKELNKKFKIDGYKFTKRNNTIILIVDKKNTVSDKCDEVINKIASEIIDGENSPHRL